MRRYSISFVQRSAEKNASVVLTRSNAEEIAAADAIMPIVIGAVVTAITSPTDAQIDLFLHRELLLSDSKPINAEAANAENCNRAENNADYCSCAKACVLCNTDNGIL